MRVLTSPILLACTVGTPNFKSHPRFSSHCLNNIQHTAKHLVLRDGGRKYLGGIAELLDFVQSAVAPPFDRSEDDKMDWAAVAQEECEVGGLQSIATRIWLCTQYIHL